MKKLLILISFLLLCSSAWAQHKGLDLLGLAQLDVKMVAQEIDHGTSIGVLKSTFGNEEPNEQYLINTGKVDCFRVHLIDGTVNGHACSGNVTSLSVLRSRAQEAKRFFIDKNPGQCAYLSPVLEYGCRDKKIIDGWFKLLATEFPQFGVVCSPMKNEYCPPGILREMHGNKVNADGSPTADFTSNDGNSLFDADSTKWQNTGRVMSLGWSYCANGRVSGEKPGDKVPPPTQRVNWCSRDEIRQLVRLMRPAQPKPATACKDVPGNEIWKTNAEYYGKGKDDGRGNKPIFISKNKFSSFDVLTTGGKKVGCLKYFGTYQGGGYRSYMGSCSKQTPTQLMDALGQEWGIMKSSGQCYNINAIRRLGSFR